MTTERIGTDVGLASLGHPHTKEINALAAHIVLPTGTTDRWKIVADPANANGNHPH